jgi:hypothetical protein
VIVPFKVPVCVTVLIDPMVETLVLMPVTVNIPLAPVNRPVPPTIVLVEVEVIGGPEFPVPEPFAKSLSPFAATMVYVTVKLNPFGPTRANCKSPLSVTFPR